MTEEENKEDLFPMRFAKDITTNKDILKKLMKFKNFRTPEIDFMASVLNILGSSLGTLDTMIRKLLEIDFESKRKTILRSNTLTTKILDHFANKRTKGFTKLVLKEPISVILNDNEMHRAEVDKNKIFKRLQANVDRIDQKRVGELSVVNPKFGKIYKQVKANAEKLKYCIKLFCDYIFSKDSVSLFPFELKVISRYIYDLSEKFGCDPLPRVGSLIILRIIGPAILFPTRKGILKKNTPISAEQSRGLMLITKGIQMLSNGIVSKEVCMQHIADINNGELQEKCNNFLRSICTPVEEIQEKKDELNKLLKLQLDEDTVTEVGLFLYYFLKSKGIKVKFPIKDGEDGQIVFAKFFHFPKEKKKKKKKKMGKTKIRKFETYKFCLEDYKKDEKVYEEEIQKIFNEVTKEQFEGQKFYQKDYFRISVLYSSVKDTFYFVVYTGFFAKHVIYEFLSESDSDFSTQNLSEFYENLEGTMKTYNEGKKHNPKDLQKILNLYLLEKQGKDSKIDDFAGEMEDLNEGVDKERRSIFKHMPTFDSVMKEYNKNTKVSLWEKLYNAVTIDSKSALEEW